MWDSILSQSTQNSVTCGHKGVRLKFFVDSLLNLFLRGYLATVKGHGPKRINELLSRLWPVTTEHPLVRIGSESCADGGYLVPDDLAEIQRIFSPGVGDKMEFESHFLDSGVPCELLDGSVGELPTKHPLANFQSFWLSARSGQKSISLDDWVSNASKDASENLLLQMDIEGGEYEVLLACNDQTLKRFSIIVVELHGLRTAFLRTRYQLLSSAVERLSKYHEIVHIHPNNCSPPLKLGSTVWPDVLEITLHRKDRILQKGARADLPNALDRDNFPNPPILLRRPFQQDLETD